jgi:hypothetical protein
VGAAGKWTQSWEAPYWERPLSDSERQRPGLGTRPNPKNRPQPLVQDPKPTPVKRLDAQLLWTLLQSIHDPTPPLLTKPPRLLNVARTRSISWKKEGLLLLGHNKIKPLFQKWLSLGCCPLPPLPLYVQRLAVSSSCRNSASSGETAGKGGPKGE